MAMALTLKSITFSVKRSEEAEERVIKIHRLIALQASETHFKSLVQGQEDPPQQGQEETLVEKCCVTA
ncbi:hypothetical protein Pint_16347 [Pistacia integerrima]|uniref:Uncharacterized protein n=1 Tax=Pistacia integerrima TaxID=434235 RepID=A0ACC0ZB39_9ROSI|nr:hypothetical protein Pint_16347 [Pistacia integerrima]